MNKKLWFLYFSKSQHLGIIYLMAFIFILQLFIFFKDYFIVNDNQKKATKEELAWLKESDTLHNQAKQTAISNNKIFPFNPNFISDYKGYKLQMTTQEIDKLLAYRKQNKFVNSAKEFQQVTGVSNEWLAKYSVYFKFPDWVNKTQQKSENSFYETTSSKFKTSVVVQKDINSATQEELEAVFMIGEKLAQKIINEREKLGSYFNMNQMKFIWGISEEALADLNKKFKVVQSTSIKKLNLNEATTKDLSNFPYFNYTIAKAIVTYRTMNRGISDFEELKKINNYPIEKHNYIIYYMKL